MINKIAHYIDLDLLTGVKALAITGMLYLGIDLKIAGVISALMLLDTITGLTKIFFISEIRFSFRALILGLLAKMILIIIPLTLALAGLGLGYDFSLLTKIAFSALVIHEVVSIFTNILSIRKKKLILNTDYVSKILYYFRNKFDSIFSKMVEVQMQNKEEDKNRPEQED